VALREEIKELRRVIENHPDVIKFAHEKELLQGSASPALCFPFLTFVDLLSFLGFVQCDQTS